MFKRLAVVSLAVVLSFQPALTRAEGMLRLQAPPQAAPAQPAPKDTQSTTKEALTDAAIIALIIAGSIAIYKATGRPCACPSDTMKNGRACGGNSAYMRPGGARPLCFAKDVTLEMIKAYRATKAIPAVW